MGDRRVNELLLHDLERALVSVDVLRALALTGDQRTERALTEALDRQGSYHIKGEIRKARARIRERLGLP